MDTPRIAPINPSPNYGVGRLKHDQDRRGRRSFEQAFAEEDKKSDAEAEAEAENQPPGVASDNTAEDRAGGSVPGGLQDQEGIIRKDEEDGQLHVDIVV
ncbi:MAG: hypothetical protein ACYST0_01980 [Planctomycetota bacterium]|jgi:hypothetical protein